MNLYGSSMTGSAVHPTSPKSVVRFSSHSNYIQHYGVPGQKWGVITKEYEPVTVDKRKTRIRKSLFSIKKTPPLKYYTAEAKAISERNDRKRKIALTVGLTAAALLAGYGIYKYARITKAKAYSGILDNFLKQNPSSNLSSEARKSLLKSGINKAKINSESLATAKSTNRYLRRAGKTINTKEALKIYKARKSIERLSNVRVGGNGSRFMEAVNKYDRRRLSRLLLSRYKI